MEKRINAKNVCMKDFKEKIDQLRNAVNTSITFRQQAWNQKNQGHWSKLWVAFDNIQDTGIAINEFQVKDEIGRLDIYGILQALVVQQTSFRHLEEALGLEPYKVDEYPKLLEIRNIRNEAIGHPSQTKLARNRSSYEDGTITYSSIIPGSKSNILEYAVWSNQGSKIKKVELIGIIQEQEDLLMHETDKILNKIKEEERLHIGKFKDKKIRGILTQSGHLIQKLYPYEPIRSYSKICLDILKKSFEEFKTEIKIRYKIEILDYSAMQIPGIILELDQVEKILPRIEKMILLHEGIDKLDLEVYVESLNNSFVALERMAEEVDQEFTT
jgi:hypothetical protein